MRTSKIFLVIAVGGVVFGGFSASATVTEFNLTGSAVTDFSSTGTTGVPLAWDFTWRSDAPSLVVSPTLGLFEGIGCSYSQGGVSYSSPTCGIEQSRVIGKDVLSFQIPRSPLLGASDIVQPTGEPALIDAFLSFDLITASEFTDPTILFEATAPALLSNLGNVLFGQAFIRTEAGFAGTSAFTFNLTTREIIQTSAVPEPGSLALFGVGLLALGAVRRTSKVASSSS